jgi:predicted O-linked N-acetylglucosamine transferase (SPINDLY family)
VIEGDTEFTARRSPAIIPGKQKLRVGFLSAYFRDPTIGRLNIGRVEHLDRSKFEVVVATTGRARDPLAHRFQRAADVFQQLPRNVAEARRLLRDLQLDVLLFADVGMDALTSTLAFSRMAPLQIVTWGHPDTTGSATMDYFHSSDLLEIDNAQSHYSERLLRPPLLATYYERPVIPNQRLTRAHWGFAEDPHLYLCPQTLFKFHPDFDEVLRGILDADPQGLIVTLEGRVPAWTQRLRARWLRTMPQHVSRIRFLPAQPRDAFLQLVQAADVMIDPLHFGGGNSSYEALAMGLPLVTLPGDYLRSRITLALYRKMGFTDLVVGSIPDFVRQAVRCGSDITYRRDIQQQSRARADVLYEDPSEIRCWADTLASLC